MKPNKEVIYDFIKLHATKENEEGVSTQYIAKVLNMQRTNVSSILSKLVEEGSISKSNGRPVLYRLNNLVDKIGGDCFSELVGYDGSLKRAVQLAKAAVLYPQKSLKSIIIGAKGTGKKYLAQLMYRFAIQNGIIDMDSKFIVFNCREYCNNDDDAKVALGGAFLQASAGVLYIDNAQYLSVAIRKSIVSYVSKIEQQEPIIIVSMESKNSLISGEFTSEFPVIIELPTLAQRPLRERMEMIQSFFLLEAARTKRTLNIKEELFRCLLLYDCETNCMQLKADIKIGCANAYVRGYKEKEQLQLFISDFEHHVRKGFLKYQNYKDEIEQIIPSNYSYIFNEQNLVMTERMKEKLLGQSIYDRISKKASLLKERGLEDSEINMLLSTDVEAIVRRYQEELTEEVTNKEQLAVLVNPRIIELVETFLEQAATKLERHFPNAVFYSLCLHISEMIRQDKRSKPIGLQQIRKGIENYKKEYQLSSEFAILLKPLLGRELEIEEVLLIAMFISYQAPIADTLNKPVILVAMYGEGVAVSLTKAIINLTKLDNIFAYEIAFETNIEEIYGNLKEYIAQINRGKGLIVVYDSDFLGDMLVSIEEELNIRIRPMSIPITTIGVELARIAAMEANVDLVYQGVSEKLRIQDSKLKTYIVAICTTGKGSAEELRRYLELYGQVEEMEIISLAWSNPDTIKEQFVDLMKKGRIHCVVGTYNPNVYSLPFISISEVFSTPKDRLPSLLRLNREARKNIDYDAMFGYLNNQFEYTNIDKLRKYLPGILKEIDSSINELTIDSEVGLFIHISCCIEHLLSREQTPINLRKEMIISKYYGQFRKLLKIMKPLEKAFGIIFTDDEIANIVTIIYRL